MIEWINSTMSSLGYVGIGLLMFLENVFPPIPSELIMPLAGFTISQGKMNFAFAVIAGVVGSILGSLPWYYVGKLMGKESLEQLADRYGKWIFVSSSDIEKANNWFGRHGQKAVFFGRLVPGVRTLISLPAGINHMPLFPFLIYSTLGSVLWVSLLTYAGYALGKNYYLLEHYIGPISKVVFVVLIVAFVVWVIKKKKTSDR